MMTLEEQELGELREVLEAVVPMIPSDFADQGLLAPPRRARQSDVAFIRKHVDEGNYELDMCGIRNKYSGFPSPPEIAQRLTRAAVRRRGDFELMVYELRYAALISEKIDLLEEFERDLNSNDKWLAEAEEIAIRALRDERIAYRGLDATFVIPGYSRLSFESPSLHERWPGGHPRPPRRRRASGPNRPSRPSHGRATGCSAPSFCCSRPRASRSCSGRPGWSDSGPGR